MRISSPISPIGISGSAWTIISSFLSPFRVTAIFITSLSVEAMLKFSSISSIFPDSIFEKSKMSLIIDSRLRPEFCMLKQFSCTVSLMSCSRRISSVIPTIAFIGVRISWLIFARKLLLELFAASASSIASASVVLRSERYLVMNQPSMLNDAIISTVKTVSGITPIP